MKDYFIGFKIAWGMMTTLPFFALHEFKKGYNGYAASTYPLIGLLLALLLNGFYLVLEDHFQAVHLNIIIFVLWIYSYGAIHLDGVSDVYDGLKSYAPKEKLSAIMKDPRIGSMGFIFTFLLLLLKLSAFIVLDDVGALLLIMMLSRYGVLFSLYFFASKGEMSANAQGEFTLSNFLVSSVFVAVVGFLLSGFAIVLWMALVALSALLIAKRLTSRFGTLNGDMYGYTIEWLEVLMLYMMIVL